MYLRLPHQITSEKQKLLTSVEKKRGVKKYAHRHAHVHPLDDGDHQPSILGSGRSPEGSNWRGKTASSADRIPFGIVTGAALM